MFIKVLSFEIKYNTRSCQTWITSLQHNDPNLQIIVQSEADRSVLPCSQFAMNLAHLELLTPRMHICLPIYMVPGTCQRKS
jgi:hypothetical protein